ncbi:MAG: ferrochelatase [Bryobacteraceae bacterium]
MQHDALLIVSFGGPEKHEDVIPFLENVLRGRNVPRERMLEVAEHYYHLEGRSPINDQVRALIAALRELFDREGPALPIYWGNRNWHPMLPDTMRQMKADGIRHARAFVTSIFSSYSGCRQYRENIEAARTEVGEGAPAIDKLPSFANHPLFLAAMADRVRDALAGGDAEVVFTAHSIPNSMSAGCAYVAQLEEACRRVTALAGAARHTLVYQSRSGPPTQPWLGPDVCDFLRSRQDRTPVVIAPIGFLSDHVEVLWDLDHDARAAAEERGIPMVRAGTVGTHPKFVRMIRELVLSGVTQVCAAECCPPPARPGSARP